MREAVNFRGEMEENNKSNSELFDALMGKEYTGVKGQAAVDKLTEEKQGHVKDAFYRDDIGEIVLFWGDDNAGLCHIIKNRSKSGISGKKFADALSKIIDNGKTFPGRSSNKLNIAYKGKVAVIAFELKGIETTALLTAFQTK